MASHDSDLEEGEIVDIDPSPSSSNARPQEDQSADLRKKITSNEYIMSMLTSSPELRERLIFLVTKLKEEGASEEANRSRLASFFQGPKSGSQKNSLSLLQEHALESDEFRELITELINNVL